MIDYFFAPALAHFAAFLFIADQIGQAFQPLFVGRTPVAVNFRGDDLFVDADGGYYCGDFHGHVLKGLESTFSACPRVVGHGHYADVDTREIFDFGFFSPGAELAVVQGQVGVLVGDDEKADVVESFFKLLKYRCEWEQVLECGV